jgi:geranylgeranyl pyrophosphate synthase
MSAAPAFALRVPRDGLADPQLRHRLADALAREAGRMTATLPWLGDAPARVLGTGGHAAGRRWRPLLALAVADACDGDADAALPVALAVECTHTASLLLDDLPCMDDAEVRRGELAAHRRLGSAGAILLAVGLLGRSAEAIARVAPGGDRLAATWGGTIGLDGMAGGQAVDLAHLGRAPARGAARRLLRRKTTALAALAAEGGAVAAGAPEALSEALSSFGNDLGWAYQLADDAMDAEEDTAAGRLACGCAPAEQARRLLARAHRRLDAMPLSDAGRDRLHAAADAIVGSMLVERT